MTTPEAGRALDDKIAEQVMGWKPFSRRRGIGSTWIAPEGYNASLGSWPHYSTSIADAWLVVEKLRADGWCVSVHEEGAKSQQWVADFVRAENDYEYTGEELAPTAPLAICRAALAACAPQDGAA